MLGGKDARRTNAPKVWKKGDYNRRRRIEEKSVLAEGVKELELARVNSIGSQEPETLYEKLWAMHTQEYDVEDSPEFTKYSKLCEQVLVRMRSSDSPGILARKLVAYIETEPLVAVANVIACGLEIRFDALTTFTRSLDLLEKGADIKTLEIFNAGLKELHAGRLKADTTFYNSLCSLVEAKYSHEQIEYFKDLLVGYRRCGERVGNLHADFVKHTPEPNDGDVKPLKDIFDKKLEYLKLKPGYTKKVRESRAGYCQQELFGKIFDRYIIAGLDVNGLADDFISRLEHVSYDDTGPLKNHYNQILAPHEKKEKVADKEPV